jgi:3-hydroxyacyl-CoA dehydrogenase
MTLDERLTSVGVIGAAGKMGSGIALLMAQEMTMQRLLPEHKKDTFELFLVDLDNARLEGLLQYLRTQAVKLAEKSIVPLRKAYQDRPELVENHEIISRFVDDFFLNLRITTDIQELKNSRLVFEAVLENADLKISLLKKLKKICPGDTFFLTNTSTSRRRFRSWWR